LSASALAYAVLMATAPAEAVDQLAVIPDRPATEAALDAGVVGTQAPAEPDSSPEAASKAGTVDSAGSPVPVADPDIAQAEPVSPVENTPAEQPRTTPGSAPNREEIVVTGQSGPPPGDPLEGVNEASFEAVQAVDEAVIAPIAHGYMKGVPKPVRSGLHNFLNNLDEPIVFLNFLLQLKPGKAIETLGRFTINSTIGVGGLIDVAKKKPFNLPRRSNGLADTLGYYGVKPGPYLFLPLIGSTTVRDVFGRLVDLSLLPTAVGKPFNDPAFALAKGTVSGLDERTQNDEVITRIREESSNPYATMREYYLKKREAEIEVLHGRRESADISISEILDPAAEDVPPTANVQPPGPETATPQADDAAASAETLPPVNAKSLPADEPACLQANGEMC